MVHSLDGTDEVVLACTCGNKQVVQGRFTKVPYFKNHMEWQCLKCKRLTEEDLIWDIYGVFLPLGYPDTEPREMEFK